MVSTHPVCTATISGFNPHFGEWGWKVGIWTWEEMVSWQPCYSRWPWTKGRMQNCCRQSVLYAFQCLLVPCSSFFLMFWTAFFSVFRQLLKLVYIVQHNFDNFLHALFHYSIFLLPPIIPNQPTVLCVLRMHLRFAINTSALRTLKEVDFGVWRTYPRNIRDLGGRNSRFLKNASHFWFKVWFPEEP